MPEIIPNQTFKHGTETYEEGKPYEVSEGEAYYFQMVGWVNQPKPEPTGEAHELDVHNSVLGHTSEVK